MAISYPGRWPVLRSLNSIFLSSDALDRRPKVSPLDEGRREGDWSLTRREEMLPDLGNYGKSAVARQGRT